MQNKFHTHTLCRHIFIIICAVISVLSLIHSTLELNKLAIARKETPFFFAGLKVAGLNKILGSEKYIGYYTDRDMDKNPKALAQFAQFQLELAPMIMDNTSLDHRFLILDCDNPARAAQKLQELKAKALSRNNYGTILAIREGY